MSAFLYTNAKGFPVSVHSYSSGAKFDSCPRDYELEKIRGFVRKGKKAALEFGNTIESAIQFFHENGKRVDSGVDEFKRIWLKYKEMDDLIYTDKEESWQALYGMGASMLKLYEVLLPSFPINEPAFQTNFKREVFPNTDLAGIHHTAFIDMVSKAPWAHPMLPRVDIPAGSAFRPLLIDIKTAGADLGEAKEMLQLDPQLREYAWTTHIPDTAFLIFVKARAGGYDRGTVVSVLADSGVFKAGQTASVVYVQKMDDEEYVEKYNRSCQPCFKSEKPKKKPVVPIRKPYTEEAIGCIPCSLVYGYEEGANGKRGKALEEYKIDFVSKYGSLVPPSLVTKVRVQFAAARISSEDMAEAGRNVGRQIVEIRECNRTGVYPKRPSVRFPNTKCPLCDKRGLCLNKPDLVERLLVQIKPAEPDWLSDEEEG